MHAVCYVAILVLFFLVQLVLTLQARRVVIKCIPALIVLTLMAGCFGAYALSSWTNWGWLILMLLVGIIQVPIALAAVIGSIVKKVKK